jgi:hypothetical protein
VKSSLVVPSLDSIFASVFNLGVRNKEKSGSLSRLMFSNAAQLHWLRKDSDTTFKSSSSKLATPLTRTSFHTFLMVDD